MQASSEDRPVGRVAGLWRYPVKSMGAEALDSVEVSWHGFAGDRRWAFVREGTHNSGFPWLTIRQCAAMSRCVPFFLEPARPDGSPTRVRAPSGREFDVTDPALPAELYPPGARVLKQDRGNFDSFPLSLVTSQTLAKLGERVGEKLAAERFRPNLLVDATEEEPFAEDRWLGRTLRIGTLRMRIDKRDGRCVIITIDPQTLERNPAILRTVAAERQGCLGVYGSTVAPGRVALHDPVFLEPG